MPKRPSHAPPAYNPHLDPNHENFDSDFFARVIVNKAESITPPPVQSDIVHAGVDMTPLEKQTARLKATSIRAKKAGTLVDNMRTSLEIVAEPFTGLDDDEEEGENDEAIDNDELAEDLIRAGKMLEEEGFEPVKSLEDEEGEKNEEEDYDEDEEEYDEDEEEDEDEDEVLEREKDIEDKELRALVFLADTELKEITTINAVGMSKHPEEIGLIVQRILDAKTDDEVIKICKMEGISTEEDKFDDEAEA